jgi:hypothetical protein
MNKAELLKTFEQGLHQGIQIVLSQALPMVPAQLRATASMYIADLVTRVLDSGGYEALKTAPLVTAPKMDLKKELK